MKVGQGRWKNEKKKVTGDFIGLISFHENWLCLSEEGALIKAHLQTEEGEKPKNERMFKMQPCSDQSE